MKTNNRKVVELDQKRIKESETRRWGKEIMEFMSQRTKEETKLLSQFVDIMCRQPDTKNLPGKAIQIAKKV